MKVKSKRARGPKTVIPENTRKGGNMRSIVSRKHEITW